MPGRPSLKWVKALDSSTHILTTSKRNFEILLECGLTMLRCTHLIEHFRDYRGRIRISDGAISVDGRSMIDLLRLAAVSGTLLTFEITGEDAEQLVRQISFVLSA